ncbi:MAG: bifunctional (p)ppGpp synthetase/guanosine-3',5'-bis(diphosphate) 3'-pyrophosphohydrolase [Planctomycetes bacterium]|nr:bifunctional (p)ppGpp synthetase/guanosine-3',5'-bis(diphosphate) 3'-pyrophosphohydrolase [Planctomycetota bacterium]
MATTPCAPADLPFLAAAFAARAHRHHTRKDNVTPYASHVFRVCLVVRHVFGFDDPKMLAAALLHDTIEDTNTDRDDIIEGFGDEVGAWVAALTKNTILPHDEREAEYCARLCAAPWQVQAIKLADIYDNLSDSGNLPPEKSDKPFKNARRYLDALRPRLKPEARPALDKLEERFPQLRPV